MKTYRVGDTVTITEEMENAARLLDAFVVATADGKHSKMAMRSALLIVEEQMRAKFPDQELEVLPFALGPYALSRGFDDASRHPSMLRYPQGAARASED